MQNERFRAKKIANELIGFFVSRNFSKLSVDIQVDSSQTIIDIEGFLEAPIRNIDKLEKILKVQRVQEYENYYEKLLGNGDVNSLRYVGYMTDEVDLESKNNQLRIIIKRYSNVKTKTKN